MQVFVSTHPSDNIRDYGLGIQEDTLSLFISNSLLSLFISNSLLINLSQFITKITETEFEKQIILKIATNWKRLKHQNIIIIDLISIDSTPDPILMGIHIKVFYKIIGIFQTHPHLSEPKFDDFSPNIFNINAEKLSNNLSHKIGRSKQFQDQLLLNEIQEFMEE